MNLRWILCLAVVIVTGCNRHEKGMELRTIRGQIDLERVLSWLPPDTETLQVANGPFWMSSFRIGQLDDRNHEVTIEELQKHFEGLALGLFGSGRGLLERHLDGKKILFAMEGSRHFRTPTGLGELPFEGSALAIFEEDLEEQQNDFMKDATASATRIEEIGGQKVAVFEEQMEQDIWTSFIAFPAKGVVLVSTNKQYLVEMLARIRGEQGQRALPDDLHEWEYLNKRAPFWGLRHYDKQQSKYDPTSPFGGKKSANFPDKDAIGMTYQCNPETERLATVTYLTGATADARKIAEQRFPTAGEPEQTAALHIQFRELEPGVIQSTFDLSHLRPLDWFFFVFMGDLGHAVYI